MDSKERPREHRNKGQGLVEFALITPVLLLVIWGIIEVAHLLFVVNTVSVASREASRYAVGMGVSGGSGLSHWQDCQGIRDAAIRLGSIFGINNGNVAIFHDTGPGTTETLVCDGANPSVSLVGLGDRITVRVTLTYSPWVKVINFPDIPLSAVSSHTILTEIPLVE